MSGSRSSVREKGNQTRRIAISYGVIAVVLLIVGFTMGWNYMASILLLCLISGIMSLGVNMQWGYAGLFNAGIMGFSALGGLAAVLFSYLPVSEVWNAAASQTWAFLGSLLTAIVVLVLAFRYLPKGRNRAWVLGLIAVVGYCVVRWLYGVAVPLIEAVNPAGSGFLGGLGIYDWFGIRFVPILGALVVFLSGGAIAAGAAFLVGKLTLGLRSDYLAIATLGISEIIIFVLKNEEWLTRGVKNVTTLPKPIWQPVDIMESSVFQSLLNWYPGEYTNEQLRVVSALVEKFFYVALFTFVLLFLFLLAERALNSPWGRMMRAIRDNEVSANAMGKNIVGRHLEIFVLGSAVVGIAGAMLTTFVGQFTPTEYIPMRFTFLIWVMVIIGGSGNNYGSILGGFLIWMIWILAEPFGNAFMSWFVNIGFELSLDFLFDAGHNDDAYANIISIPSILEFKPDLAQHLINVAPQLRLMLMGGVLLFVLRFSPSGILPEVVPGRTVK